MDDNRWQYQKSGVYRRDKNPNWRGGKEVPCAYCGKLVYKKPSDIEKVKNVFCSKECHDEFRRKPKDPNRLKADEMKGEKHPRWVGTKHCQVCGKELLSRTERRRGTCSKECSRIKTEEGVIKGKVALYGPSAGRATYTCEYCGKVVETKKSAAERRRFCSNKCHILSGTNLQYAKPTKLEVAVSEALTELGLDFVGQYAPEGSPGIYDFYVPSRNLLIEADGEFWHYSEWANEQFHIQERDARKAEWANVNSYKLIRLREKDVLKKGALVLLREALV